MVREGPARAPRRLHLGDRRSPASLYFNFAWFREQFCVVLCPYGRLQSVLHDRDSIVIAYDARRGEPRGKLSKRPTPAPAAGDCIDCKKCVWACPTGIDIRNGLQMECLACAQCIDACDEVMAKIARPTGLIRYTSLNAARRQAARVLRPRLYVYAAAAFIAVSGAVTALAARTPFEATVVRSPGVPWVVDGARVRNQVEIHLTNKRGVSAAFHLAVQGPVPADVRLGQTTLTLPALGDTRVPLVITVDSRDLRPGLTFTVDVRADDGGASRRQELRFVAPAGLFTPPPRR